MIFYEITLKSLPRILFAYPVQVEHYQNHFHKPTNFLELCLVEEGEIVYQYSDQPETHIVPGTFDPVLQDMDCDTYAFCDMPQRQTNQVQLQFQKQEENADNAQQCIFPLRGRILQRMAAERHLARFALTHILSDRLQAETILKLP